MSEEMTKEKQEAMDKAFSRSMPEGLRKVHNEYSNVKKIYGIISGKGGVGKSLVTSLMAVRSQRNGLKTAIMDGDITGPSIPKSFNVHGKTYGTDMGIMPASTKTGIKLMSINLLVENEEDPVIWRGPVIAGAVQQFWTDVAWGDVDNLFVDMPPGTGDVPLTVFQAMPVDGIIVVTSPQELVEMIVAKAVKMANAMNVPIIGLVENMSYFECPNCNERHEIFGKSRVEEIAKKYGIDQIAKLPIDPSITQLVDSGNVEEVPDEFIKNLDSIILK